MRIEANIMRDTNWRNIYFPKKEKGLRIKKKKILKQGL